MVQSAIFEVDLIAPWVARASIVKRSVDDARLAIQLISDREMRFVIRVGLTREETDRVAR